MQAAVAHLGVKDGIMRLNQPMAVKFSMLWLEINSELHGKKQKTHDD